MMNKTMLVQNQTMIILNKIYPTNLNLKCQKDSKKMIKWMKNNKHIIKCNSKMMMSLNLKKRKMSSQVSTKLLRKISMIQANTMPLRKRKQKQTPKNKVMNSKENKELGVHLLTDINIVKSLQQGLIKSIWDQAYTQICQTQDPEGLHQSKWRKRNLGKENYLSS